MNDRAKTVLGVTGVAAGGYAVLRGLEWVGKKAIKKVKELKAQKSESSETIEK